MTVDFLHSFVTGFLVVFGWPTFGLMLIGIGIGFLIGILPGISAPTTLAIMLPFTFGMKPVEAFAVSAAAPAPVLSRRR